MSSSPEDIGYVENTLRGSMFISKSQHYPEEDKTLILFPISPQDYIGTKQIEFDGTIDYPMLLITQTDRVELNYELTRKIREITFSMPDATNFGNLILPDANNACYNQRTNEIESLTDFLDKLPISLKEQVLEVFTKSARQIFIQNIVDLTGKSPQIRFDDVLPVTVGDIREVYKKIIPEKRRIFTKEVAFTALSFRKEHAERAEV